MRVIEETNTSSITGSGCESFWRGPLDWIRGWGGREIVFNHLNGPILIVELVGFHQLN